MKAVAQDIPDILIYEMIDGKPIYYKGYRDYLSGKKQLAEIRSSTMVQGFLAAKFSFFIKSTLGDDYLVFTRNLGLQISQDTWRIADIAAIKKADFNTKLNDKYLEIPPEYVIEIDTKADFTNFSDSTDYFHQKTQALLDFGVKKVVWIFTASQKVMIAEQGNTKWEIYNWNQSIEFIPEILVNVQELLDESGLV